MTDHIHEGYEEAIQNLKDSDSEQKGDFNHMKDKVDSIMTRLNVILGGIVVAVVSLLANILFKTVEKLTELWLF